MLEKSPADMFGSSVTAKDEANEVPPRLSVSPLPDCSFDPLVMSSEIITTGTPPASPPLRQSAESPYPGTQERPRSASAEDKRPLSETARIIQVAPSDHE